jgi:hypothetical protein
MILEDHLPLPSWILGLEAAIKERIMHGFPVWFGHHP